MKWLTAIAIGAVVLTSAGCQKQKDMQRTHWEKKDANRAMIDHRYVEYTDAGILAEQTLFPYHFHANGADLNGLGERDVEVLARHYRNYPGTLNVRKGPADDDLYADRVGHVLDALADLGVDTTTMEVTDGMAGGDGVHSARALLLDERTAEPVQSIWDMKSDR